MSPLLQVHDLRVSFGRRKILHGVSLEVPPGQTIALVGANGSGKSTFLRALIRMELLDSGHGQVLGHSILSDDASYNTGIGYVSEILEFQLPVKLSAIADLYKDLRPGFSMADFERVTKEFRLDVSKKASEYSRGQKMQFAFALAVAAKPKLILLDEVTAVLDLHVRDLVMREVRELTLTGSSALIATNILTEVLPYADRLLILEDGKLALDTELRELERHYVKIRGRSPARTLTGAAALVEPSVTATLLAKVECRAIKGSADGALTYLLPRTAVSDLEASQAEHSQEPVNGEDVFLYHCRKGA
jgi:ABC-2 type transport system ATP-binding protein